MNSLRALGRFSLFAAFAVFFAPSCGGSEATCVNYCEDHKQCSDVDKDWKFVDCDEICTQVDAVVTDAGCEDSYDAYMTCISKSPSVCEDDDLFEDICDAEWRGFEKCSDDYCDKHHDACDAFGGSSDTVAGGSSGGVR